MGAARRSRVTWRVAPFDLLSFFQQISTACDAKFGAFSNIVQYNCGSVQLLNRFCNNCWRSTHFATNCNETNKSRAVLSVAVVFASLCVLIQSNYDCLSVAFTCFIKIAVHYYSDVGCCRLMCVSARLCVSLYASVSRTSKFYQIIRAWCRQSWLSSSRVALRSECDVPLPYY